MFCPKCGTQLPDDAQFCNKCGAQLGNTPAPRKKEAFKLPTRRGWLTLAFMTILFVLGFAPFVDAGPSVSVLAIEAFSTQAMLGVSKIFLIIALVIYIGALALTFIDIGLPSIVKKFLPLCYYGTYFISLFFIFIASVARNGITMGAAWYIILVFLAFAVLFELLPKLFKVEEKEEKKED